MMRISFTRKGLVFFSALLLSLSGFAGIREKSDEEMGAPKQADSAIEPAADAAVEPADTKSEMEMESDELLRAKEALRSTDEKSSTKDAVHAAPAKESKNAKKINRSAEAFVAGADWEFDGFVAGGQDQAIKSMFATNDLLYLNIGLEQGLKTGTRLGVYRRGERIKDPQTGKPIGFEVRKLAIAEVTDRIDAQNCSARILKSYEHVEIGDLVRRE